MRGKLVTLFGGGGFVGRYVVEALLDAGARVRVAVREPGSALFLKPLGNLGQIQLVRANILHEESVRAAVSGADAVVNLVGIFGSAKAMQTVNSDAAAMVAQAARAANVQSFIHFSALGAADDSASAYGRSKAAGEAGVLQAFPTATIIRPSIIFGREDKFINRFANTIRMMPIVPVIGGDTQFQPVYAGDVAKAATAALEQGVFQGSVLELGGPEAVSMLDLNHWIADAIGRKRGFVEVPDAVAGVLAAATGWLPGAPITSDQFKMLANDNVVTGLDGLVALGIPATPLDAVAHDWLNIYRKHGRFAQEEAQRAVI